MKKHRYPLAGELQQKTQTQLAGNPEQNPFEVHSASGLEDRFARQEDAETFADELRRIGARDVRIEKRARRYRRPNPEEETCDTNILGGMARALWVTSFADWVESMDHAERKAAGVPVRLSGIEWDDAAPETPESAVEAARDLYLLIERANGKTPGELFARACEVDGCDHDDDNASLFGHYLAMEAIGSGVSWFDDHKEFPIKFPRGFEAHYDDGEIWWSPQVRSRQNPDAAAGWRLGDPLVLGTYAPGSHVQLADYSSGDRRPSDWVTVVGNYADTTGVVVVKVDRNRAIVERDGRAPLYGVDRSRSEKVTR